MTTPAIRMIGETEDTLTIEGRLAFGGPFGGRDSYGTTFSARTDWGFRLHPHGIPVLYNHGFDPDFGLDPIGFTAPPDSFRAEPDGVWVQMQLDKRHHYYETRIKPLLDAGAVGLSQGSAEHSVQISERTGEVLVWPLHEVSLTPTESNPWNLIATRTAEVVSIISARAEMSSAEINDLPDSDFAYIEPGGTKDEQGKTIPRSKRHFPIHDAAHVRNALARLATSPFGEQARAAVEAAAKKFGIEIAERSAVRSSWDAATAARLLSDLLMLRDVERAEPDQVTILDEAIDALQRFVAAEAAEPDDDGDALGVMSGVRAGRRNNATDQSNLDAAHAAAHAAMDHTRSAGAMCQTCAPTDTSADGEPDDGAARTADAPTTVSIVGRADAAAVRADLLELASRVGASVARELTG